MTDDNPADGSVDEAIVQRFNRAHFQDAGSEGEAQAMYKDEHLCVMCVSQGVCIVAHATQQLGPALVTISRCRAFEPHIDASG